MLTLQCVRRTRPAAGVNLVTFNTCSDLDLLRKELLYKGYDQGQEFFVGHFYIPTNRMDERRRSSSADAVINS